MKIKKRLLAIENTLNFINKILKGTDYICIYKNKLYMKELTTKFTSKYSMLENYIEDNIPFKNSYIKLAGGFLFLQSKTNKAEKYLLLALDFKTQGIKNGAKNNGTVERLGKNLTFIRSYMFNDEITPYICFGNGKDFSKKSILSKILQMNYGLKLNTIFLKSYPNFQPVSMYFQEKEHSIKEVEKACKIISINSLKYYIQKHKLNIKLK